MKIIKFFLTFCVFPLGISAQVTLKATGEGDAYKIITDAFSPEGNIVEVPDCIHPEFGPHITQVYDPDLDQYVFAFHIHVTPDNDRCKRVDRQRVEIKTYANSSNYLKGFEGETVRYEWLFKLPKGFQPSPRFTHLHQIKAVGGEDGMPIFTLTARAAKGKKPAQIELNHIFERILETAEMSLFEGEWVKVVETIKIDTKKGAYEIEIRTLKTNKLLLQHKTNAIQTILPGNAFIRPKWGIYRSILDSNQLRDEIVYFDDFIVFKESETTKLNAINKSNEDLLKFEIIKKEELKVNYVLEKDNSELRLDILDAGGEVVKTFRHKRQQTKGSYEDIIDLSDLASGSYFLRFISDTYAESRAFSL